MKFGLRARVAIAFALLAFTVSVALAALTYQIARNYLVDQRDALVVRQAGLNARALNAGLDSSSSDVSSLIASLPSTSGSHGVALVQGEWISSSLPTRGQNVPEDIVNAAVSGQAVKQRVTIAGVPTMVVGVPLNAEPSAYFEIAPLNELQRTLSLLARSLTAGAAFTAVVGALVGLYASRRVLRPLLDFSHAAEQVGRGRLDTRLSVTSDRDLAAFGAAFNDMAESLEHRTERDARFASDVSHELRNPLTALIAAVDVLDARAGERARPAVNVLRTQVAHFSRLVLDLLELARLDARAGEVLYDEVDPREYFPAAVERAGGRNIDVVVGDDVPRPLLLDQRRIDRVLANLIDNAQRHGGGATRVEVRSAGGKRVQIAVEDSGPGIPERERARVFDRFHRGARQPDETGGSGLGLSIVVEHCRAHGGAVRIEESAGGGARFVAVFTDGDAK